MWFQDYSLAKGFWKPWVAVGQQRAFEREATWLDVNSSPVPSGVSFVVDLQGSWLRRGILDYHKLPNYHLFL